MKQRLNHRPLVFPLSLDKIYKSSLVNWQWAPC